MANDLLFVYGTLRRDSDIAICHHLKEHSEYVGEATFQGMLFRVSHFPGVVSSTDSSDVVHGEVYRLYDSDLLLSRLDEYESFSPSNPQSSLFVRELHPIRLQPDETCLAWIYLFNHSTEGLELIPSGDFFSTH